MRSLRETDDPEVIGARSWARAMVGAMVDVLDRYGLLAAVPPGEVERARRRVFADEVFAEWLPERLASCNGWWPDVR